MNKRELERLSSAYTLSDMELFVFPELLYSLVLANIMSPCIWEWRNDPWFKGVELLSPYKRVLRLKQYIMDHYAFNLDLETWGLTTKETELSRFSSFIDHETLRQSNALFGYEGDKYYFDVNIRKHFGLDAYDGSIIPYWKTETVEAMNAFRFKEGFSSGAGECVSLATLYAAALFIIARIPLADIFLLATPLHSQNFIALMDGILTNNRRIVTKAMWINGTELSAKARRALENERVTIVAHASGYIHTIYPEATIDRTHYASFTKNLTHFVQSILTPEVLGNFIRYRRDLQKCFQIRWELQGHTAFIPSEKVFSYELNSPHLYTSGNRKFLMQEIDIDDYQSTRIEKRIILNDLEEYVRTKRPDLTNETDCTSLREAFSSDCFNATVALEALIQFCRVTPQLPDITKKSFTAYSTPLGITESMTRHDIIEHMQTLKDIHPIVHLAWFAYRDVRLTGAGPFLYAAFERNPVALTKTQHIEIPACITAIQELPSESIYDEPGRLAQPDEVWNYQRGDGLEKAILLAHILKNRTGEKATLSISETTVTCTCDTHVIIFPTTKGIAPQVWHSDTVNNE